MSEKERFIEILADSFPGNPAVNWMVKKGRSRSERYEKLAQYIFNHASRRNGIYYARTGKGVLVSFNAEESQNQFKDAFGRLWLVLNVIGLSHSLKVARREKEIKQLRLKENHIYVWFLGVHTEDYGSKTVFELKNYIFEKSQKLQLPIFAETAIERVRKAYEYFGFEIYNSHITKDGDLTTWLLRWPAKIN